MRIPFLNRRLTLWTRTRVADGAGGFAESWEEAAVLWGEVRARSGRDVRGLAVTLSETGYRIRVRALPVGSGGRPVAGQRMTDAVRRYRIEAVTEDDPSGRYLLCFATEETVT